jgi:hypothetical protein
MSLGSYGYKVPTGQFRERMYKIKKLYNKINVTTIPHHRSIGKVLLLYFIPINKKVNLISEITLLRTMSGYSL